MRFVFYNVENLFDTENDPKTRDDDFTPSGRLSWDDSRYFEKLDDISEVVLAAGGGTAPAFLALCEVENYKVVKALADHRDLAHIGYKIIHAESRDQRGIDNALLYDPSAFELENYEWLNIDQYSDNQLFSRDILHAWGTLSDGQKLHIYVNHWPSRRSGTDETAHKRKAASNTLRESLEALDLGEELVIACGDFNDSPSDWSLQNLHDIEQGELLINLADSLEKNEKGTVFRDDQWWAFDQFIVNKKLLPNIKKGKMKILEDEFILYRNREGISMPNRTYVGPRYTGGFSDHLPIYLNLELQQ